MRRVLLALGGVVALLAAMPQAQNYPAARTGGDYMHNYYLPPAGWYSVRAIGAPRTFPVENTRPQAQTSPVYVIVDGQPIRDRASAEYFVRWIDRLTEMAAAHPGWRSDKEKAHVLAQFAEARAIYQERAK